MYTSSLSLARVPLFDNDFGLLMDFYTVNSSLGNSTLGGIAASILIFTNVLIFVYKLNKFVQNLQIYLAMI